MDGGGRQKFIQMQQAASSYVIYYLNFFVDRVDVLRTVKYLSL